MMEQQEEETGVTVVCTAGMNLELLEIANRFCRVYSEAWAVNSIYPATLEEHTA
jgi:hypothetical protein